MNEEQTEKAIQAAGKTAPRITPAHIDAVIGSEVTFVVGDVCKDVPLSDATKVLTICVLTLRNGFTVTGESACASPENFDEQIGRDIARKNAREKIWLLEGYLLKQRLYDHENSGPGIPQA